jgi:hypothetical protein
MNEKDSVNDSSVYEQKLDLGSIQRKRLKSSPNSLLKEEKYFYGVFTQIVSLLEACAKTTDQRKRLADKRHIADRIRDAETWRERDKVVRDLAAYCYEEGKKFAKLGTPDMQIKWFKLLVRFLKVNPDDVAFDKELADLKARMDADDAAEDPDVQTVADA